MGVFDKGVESCTCRHNQGIEMLRHPQDFLHTEQNCSLSQTEGICTAEETVWGQKGMREIKR